MKKKRFGESEERVRMKSYLQWGVVTLGFAPSLKQQALFWPTGASLYIYLHGRYHTYASISVTTTFLRISTIVCDPCIKLVHRLEKSATSAGLARINRESG